MSAGAFDWRLKSLKERFISLDLKRLSGGAVLIEAKSNSNDWQSGWSVTHTVGATKTVLQETPEQGQVNIGLAGVMEK